MIAYLRLRRLAAEYLAAAASVSSVHPALKKTLIADAQALLAQADRTL